MRASELVKRQSMEFSAALPSSYHAPLPRQAFLGRVCADPDTGERAPRALSRPCSATRRALGCVMNLQLTSDAPGLGRDERFSFIQGGGGMGALRLSKTKTIFSASG